MNGGEVSTPVILSKKRELTSPDFPLDLKRNKLLEKAAAVKLPESDDSDILDIPADMMELMAEDSKEEQPTLSAETMQNITLGPMHMQAIADVLKESFRDELRQSIREEIPGIVTPIVNGVVQGLKDQISKLQSDNQKLIVENQELKRRVSKLELVADSAEQYSKRNSLRMSGIPENLVEDTVWPMLLNLGLS